MKLIIGLTAISIWLGLIIWALTYCIVGIIKDKKDNEKIK